MDKIIGAF